MKWFSLFALPLVIFLCPKGEKSPNYLSTFQVNQLPETPSVDEGMLNGAWTTTYENEEGTEITITMIVEDGFLAKTYYNEEQKLFMKTYGGSWKMKGNVLKLNVDFSSKGDPEVGTDISFPFEATDGKMQFEGEDFAWERVDVGDKSPLAGAWFFAGRKQNGEGEISRRALAARKTMKILSDSRFQWIAYNEETGDFRGTGGGTYSAEKGKYVENIQFFSRDSSRVGASLSFDFEVVEGEWHHSGFSSKGDPMYEVWSTYEKLSKGE